MERGGVLSSRIPSGIASHHRGATIHVLTASWSTTAWKYNAALQVIARRGHDEHHLHALSGGGRSKSGPRRLREGRSVVGILTAGNLTCQDAWRETGRLEENAAGLGLGMSGVLEGLASLVVWWDDVSCLVDEDVEQVDWVFTWSRIPNYWSESGGSHSSPVLFPVCASPQHKTEPRLDRQSDESRLGLPTRWVIVVISPVEILPRHPMRGPSYALLVNRFRDAHTLLSQPCRRRSWAIPRLA